MINFCEVIEISNNLSFLLNFGTSRLLLPLSSLAETALDRHLNRQPILFSNFSLDFLLTLNSPHPKIAPDFDFDPEFEENKHFSVPLYR